MDVGKIDISCRKFYDDFGDKTSLRNLKLKDGLKVAAKNQLMNREKNLIVKSS